MRRRPMNARFSRCHCFSVNFCRPKHLFPIRQITIKEANKKRICRNYGRRKFGENEAERYSNECRLNMAASKNKRYTTKRSHSSPSARSIAIYYLQTRLHACDTDDDDIGPIQQSDICSHIFPNCFVQQIILRANGNKRKAARDK